MVIKSVLREELRNSRQLKRRYEGQLKQLPKGSLVKKRIKNHEYYYLVLREKGKVRFIYKGKKVSSAEKKKYSEAKRLRAKYRRLLSQVNKQIKFLEKSL
jgi:hypothetical protein